MEIIELAASIIEKVDNPNKKSFLDEYVFVSRAKQLVKAHDDLINELKESGIIDNE